MTPRRWRTVLAQSSRVQMMHGFAVPWRQQRLVRRSVPPNEKEISHDPTSAKFRFHRIFPPMHLASWPGYDSFVNERPASPEENHG